MTGSFKRDHISRPGTRSRLRSVLGKEYFIVKRHFCDLLQSPVWASGKSAEGIHWTTVIRHSSPLIRKLKDLEMQLQYNKVTNLSIALKCLNGVIIRPGESFSFWRMVGRPTAGKGYLPGLVLHQGALRSGIGGGLCQLGNLLYWMLLHSSMVVTERWRHSYDVFPDVDRNIPFGSGATLAYNYLDLRCFNPTQNVYLIRLWMDRQDLFGELLCSHEDETYEVYEKEHRFEPLWWGGYARCNEIWRCRLGVGGERLQHELITKNHALLKYEPLLPASEEK
jgi:vancomycin resistance protein VanW